jgi:nucleoside-diphosphate-sugar epimerase
MNVVITGSSGFLGRRLAEALLQRGTLTTSSGAVEAIDRLVMLDITPPPYVGDDPRVMAIAGDLSERAVLERAIDDTTDAIFHLAAVVSGGAEADFDLGMRVNLRVTEQVLELCRRHGRRPKVVFTSSVAVYGGDLPETPGASTALLPQSSYGVQKAIGELLINDYSRREFIDGRSLRLPTISVRPGRPNAALSSFASGIIREPLNGETGICPVSADTRLWLLSPATAVTSLIVGHELDTREIGMNRSVIVPGISVTTGEMVAALERVAGPEVASRVQWIPNAHIQRVVGAWPGALDDTRARSLGFPTDRSFDGIIRQYIAEQSPRTPLRTP